MKTPPPDLRARLRSDRSGALRARDAAVSLGALAAANPLSVEPASLDGAHVLLRTRSQLTAGLALIALDGIAGRILIAPPDLKDRLSQGSDPAGGDRHPGDRWRADRRLAPRTGVAPNPGFPPPCAQR